jgi:hypothetical protein
MLLLPVVLLPFGLFLPQTTRGKPSLVTTWKVRPNHREIAGSFESLINQAFFNTKVQRVKEGQSNFAFDPLC